MSKKKTKRPKQKKKRKVKHDPVKRLMQYMSGLTIVFEDHHPLDLSPEAKAKIDQSVYHENKQVTPTETARMYNSLSKPLLLDTARTWRRRVELYYHDRKQPEVIEDAYQWSLNEILHDTDKLNASKRAEVALERPNAILKRVIAKYTVLGDRRVAREYEVAA